jgi:hypothetical protein
MKKVILPPPFSASTYLENPAVAFLVMLIVIGMVNSYYSLPNISRLPLGGKVCIWIHSKKGDSYENCRN